MPSFFFESTKALLGSLYDDSGFLELISLRLVEIQISPDNWKMVDCCAVSDDGHCFTATVGSLATDGDAGTCGDAGSVTVVVGGSEERTV